MKIAFSSVLLFIITCLNAQVARKQAGSAGTANCEDLVFNTRELTQFAYNTPCKTESYPFISEDGYHLYYTNNQSYNWIFYTRKDSTSRIWSVPVPLEIASYSSPIRSCFLNKAMNVLYFTSESNEVFRCESSDGSNTRFGVPEKIEILTNGLVDKDKASPFSCLSFSEDFRQMTAFTGKETVGSNYPSMARFIKTGDNAYTFMEYITLDSREIGVMSNDGLTYYFTNQMFKNILFCRRRESPDVSFDKDVFMVKVFEPHLNVSQVRIAETGLNMVMVLSEDLWSKNDIFFYEFEDSILKTGMKKFDTRALLALKGEKVNALPVLVDEKSAPEPLKKVEILNQTGAEICKIEVGRAFPNPARNQFHIYYHVSGADPEADLPVLVLLNQQGRILYSQKLDYLQGEAWVKLETVPSGATIPAGSYYVRIDYNGLNSALSRINFNY